MHNHQKEEQIYIVVSGSGVIQVGEERTDVTLGDVVYFPVNVPHGFFNTSKKPAVILNIGAGVA